MSLIPTEYINGNENLTELLNHINFMSTITAFSISGVVLLWLWLLYRACKE